jgi:hypothetical protein
VTKPSKNALLDAMRKFGRAEARRPPGDGWFTLDELARQESQETGQVVTVSAMRYRLKMAQKRGVRIESATGTALDDEGNAKRATYYRMRE